jgi:FKBP-type peptidyl-prolyl cis-trans isomerase
MINKYEAIGILVCAGLMAVALFLMRLDNTGDLLGSIDADTQAASIVVSNSEGEDSAQALAQSLASSMDASGEIKSLIIDDVVLGSGEAVEEGDTVSVHYIGTLQNGQQFDNSYVKGDTFTFEVGKGEVIKGWDQGLVGMKEGGQRILVVPASLAYGNTVVGPIPANSTLIFSVELVDIK